MAAIVIIIICSIIIQPARLERQGCYWQTVPPHWGGGRLFGASVVCFYLIHYVPFPTKKNNVNEVPRWFSDMWVPELLPSQNN